MTNNTVNFDGHRWPDAEVDVIQLVAPNLDWPAQFEVEAQTIRALLGDAANELRVEHVGSTAIPALAAKPIIDVLIIPTDGTWPKEMLIRQLPLAGYVFWAENPDPWHLFFVKGMPPYGSGRTHHIHVRPPERAESVIVFRDYLRTHPEAADVYATLKLELAAAHPNDREAYTRGKDEFVADVLRQARTTLLQA